MDSTRLVWLEQVLIDALDRLGVVMRREPLGEGLESSTGGLCHLHGQQLLFLDPNAPAAHRVRVLTAAVRSLDHESIWLPPAARFALAED